MKLSDDFVVGFIADVLSFFRGVLHLSIVIILSKLYVRHGFMYNLSDDELLDTERFKLAGFDCINSSKSYDMSSILSFSGQSGKVTTRAY